MAKGGIVSRIGASRIGKVAGAGKVVRRTASKAKATATKTVKEVPPPSPNPMTNLIIADIVLRGGGRLLRNLVERNVLKAKYPPETAKSIVTGRGMAQTLVGTAIARIATRSVPGAILVGGGLVAKALYDRRKGHDAKTKGEKAIARRVVKGT
ncbi:MAG: hypothetical protein JWQ16_2438 [Novosphingobium sp.]|nr:hypothetical protein [Novosphingobium sp.]